MFVDTATSVYLSPVTLLLLVSFLYPQVFEFALSFNHPFDAWAEKGAHFGRVILVYFSFEKVTTITFPRLRHMAIPKKMVHASVRVI